MENWGLIGHEWAVHMLQGRLAHNRLGHAYLITGSPGVGRSTLALRLAQAVNCLSAPQPCGDCRACILIERGIHPDVSTLRAEGRSIKTDMIREMQQDFSLQPLEARYKVVIVEEIEQATDNAADALLKTLEEPPRNAKLILTADNVQHVRPTIVSRSQVIALRPVPAGAIQQALEAYEGVTPEQAAMLAHLAAGRPGWALRALTDETILAERAALQDAILSALHADRVGRFKYVEEIYRREGLIDLLELWQAWWRDVLLRAEGSGVPPINADRYDEIEGLATQLTREEVRTALRAVRETLGQISATNVNKRLALEVMMLRMPYL